MTPFMDAAALWAERKSVPISFFRTEVGDWVASIKVSDGYGKFAAFVPFMEPREKTKKEPAETPEDFEARVAKAMSDAMVRLRKSRIGISRTEAELREASIPEAA